MNTSEAAAGHGHGTETCKDSSTSYSASPSPSSSSCISYGDLNLEKGGPGEDQDQDQDQEGQESNTFDPSPTTVSSSSIGQHKSNIVDGAKPSVNTNANANDDSRLQTSVSKEITTGDELIEIPLPLESDAGIWSIMFDESFDPKGESNIVAQPPEYYEEWPRSSLREGHEEEEFEYQKWLRYLENELGLLGGTDSDVPALKGEDQQQQLQQQQQQEELVTRGTEKDDEMILRPEIDPDDDDDDDMAYFPMWPSSPQNFDF